jgi:hypothetical protein
MGVAVTEANLQDRLGGAAVLMEESCSCEQLQLIWVDQGYTGKRACSRDRSTLWS